ncbi:MAG: nitrile hydratase subunit beta [Burkholderiales bacterium]|nr:nitrile hydratase subunit beta [Burkholderiales bacterium]
MGRARLRDVRRHLRLLRLHGGRVPPRDREDGPGALPRSAVLRALARGIQGLSHQVRAHHERRARRAHQAHCQRRPMMLLTPDIVPAVTSTGATARVAANVAPRFRVGDQILVNNIHPTTHTRLPAYLRGKRGVIERDHGVFAYPEHHAHHLPEKPQHCYAVRFTARELWGSAVNSRDTLVADLFDDYMELR